MLSRCIDAVLAQRGAGFTFSVVVVDNDSARSAREVARLRDDGSGRVVYVCEERQSISWARNAAVAHASGTLIAFLDDDEFPEPEWLSRMYKTLRSHGAAGVLGPVLPHFEATPPAWLMKSGLCLRQSFDTGTPLRDTRYMRTGNVLLARPLFDGVAVPFDPRFGRTGGEDAEFFGRMLTAGHSFVWCNEARVYEEVPKERQTLAYHFRRSLLRGMTEAEHRRILSYDTAKSLVAIAAYALVLPVAFVAAYPVFVKYLVRLGDHGSKLLAHAGIRVVRERGS
jgi:glycosyltransferase involved in cell wall biosynthesis